MISASWASFWDVTAILLDAFVAVSVFGESVSQIVPPALLPPFVNNRIECIGKWSTWLLIVSLVAVVPVGLVRDKISSKISLQLATDLKKAQKKVEELKQPRNMTPKSQHELSSKLKKFGTKDFTLGVLIGGLEPGSKLTDELYASLIAAGWRLVPAKNKSTARGQPAPNNGVVEIIGIAGVKIFFSRTRADDFAAACALIANQLNAEGITTETVALPANNDADPNVINISIGAKT